MKTSVRVCVNLNVVVEPDEGGFHAYCPALKGLHAPGNTEREAVRNAKNAATAYLYSFIEHYRVLVSQKETSQ